MKKKGVLQVRLDVDDLEQLKKHAKDTGHSMSSLARHILMEYLRYKQKNKDD